MDSLEGSLNFRSNVQYSTVPADIFLVVILIHYLDDLIEDVFNLTSLYGSISYFVDHIKVFQLNLSDQILFKMRNESNSLLLL